MSRRLGVDFGTSNSVVSVWDEARGRGSSLAIPELSTEKEIDGEGMSVVPSLVNYADPNTTWYGGQVLTRNLYDDQQRTFRWMKRYVSQRLAPVPRHVSEGRSITPLQLARTS